MYYITYIGMLFNRDIVVVVVPRLCFVYMFCLCVFIFYFKCLTSSSERHRAREWSGVEWRERLSCVKGVFVLTI